MTQDAYIRNRVVAQLIQTPASSAAQLAQLASGSPVANPPQAAEALVRARGWLAQPFRAAYQAPAGVGLLAVAREAGQADVIRARYTAAGLDLEVAQTRYLLSVRLRGLPAPAAGQELAHAEQLARRIFAMDPHLRFERLAMPGPVAWGLQATAGRQAADPDWPHWADRMRWWVTGNDAGFVTLKALGGPTREVIGPMEDMNLSWFGP